MLRGKSIDCVSLVYGIGGRFGILEVQFSEFTYLTLVLRSLYFLRMKTGTCDELVCGSQIFDILF